MRFIKYEWLDVKAYQGWACLVNHIEEVLRQFGDKYVIRLPALWYERRCLV